MDISHDGAKCPSDGRNRLGQVHTRGRNNDAARAFKQSLIQQSRRLLGKGENSALRRQRILQKRTQREHFGAACLASRARELLRHTGSFQQREHRACRDARTGLLESDGREPAETILCHSGTGTFHSGTLYKIRRRHGLSQKASARLERGSFRRVCKVQAALHARSRNKKRAGLELIPPDCINESHRKSDRLCARSHAGTF